MKKLIVIALLSSLVGLMLVPGPQAVAAGKTAKPVTVATDDPADWGVNVEPTINPAGTPLGMELLGAQIGLAEDKKTVNFIIQLAGPTAGGIPELVRYGWELTVDGNAYQLNGGRTELVRGMCNPLVTDPACPPNVGDPATLTNFPFFVRSGSCLAQEECKVHVVVNATYDSAAGTITIPVPMDAIGAKLGSVIGPNGGTFGALYAAPGALVTTNSLPYDAIALTKTIKLPKR
jgi:hypothetical protein